MARLSDDKKVELARRFQGGESATSLADEYGVHRTHVYRIGKMETFAAVKAPMSEFGVTGLNRFGGEVMEDYLRPWQQLQTMVPLVKEMLDYPIIGAVMFAIEMMFRQANWQVTPASEEDPDLEAAEFLDGCREDLSHTWDEHLSQVVSMLGFGFAPFEVVYKKRLGQDKEPSSHYDDGLIGWRKLAFRAQDTVGKWLFDEAGGVQGMVQSTAPDYNDVEIPIEKMILYRTTAAKNNPQGRSALRTSYIPWYYAKNFQEIEGIAAERTGAGLPIVYLGSDIPTGTNSEVMTFAKQLVRDTRVDSQMGIVIPYPKMVQSGDRAGKGILFEFVSPTSMSGFDFKSPIDRYNQQISQTLLAQFIFLGISERGTQSLAVRATDFFTQAIEGWLDGIADTLNLFAVPRLFKLNATKFGNISDYPSFVVDRLSQVDVEKLFMAIEKATGTKFLLPRPGDERAVRQLLELPEMTEEDEEREREEYLNPPEEPVPPVVVQPKEEEVDLGKQEEVEQNERQIQMLEKLVSDATVAVEKLKVADKPQVINYHFPPQPDVNVDIHEAPHDTHITLPKQPDVYVDVQPANVNVTTPEMKAPDVYVNTPDVRVDIKPPDIHVAGTTVTIPKQDPTPINVNVDAVLQAPDEIHETETIVDRDAEGFIRRTVKSTLKKTFTGWNKNA